MKRRWPSIPLLTLLVVAVGALAACRGGRTERAFLVNTGGDPERGAVIIDETGCGSCHRIPGIRGARGLVGPPLLLFGRRTFIAGEAPNKPENLVRWIRSPQSIEPATAMPALGLTEQQARDVAAYLYTLVDE